MARLNIDYELLTWEGDILRLKFWARAFEVLKETGAVFLQTEGKHAGCWVMKIDEDSAHGGDRTDGRGEDDDPEAREKVIVRSNGTVVYVGKDMAYQFWKSGLLGKDFLYRQFATRMDGSTLWATTSDPACAVAEHPHFGDAAATYNVIDVAAVVPAETAEAGADGDRPSAGSRATRPLLLRDGGAVARHRARTGLRADADSEEAKKPFVEVSGRKGLGVKADDLIDRVIDKALVEVDRRQSRTARRRAPHDRGTDRRSPRSATS